MRKPWISIVPHRIVSIGLWITGIVWLILTAIIFFKYVDYSNIKETTKWWTFVEGIYEPISYLPYRGDPIKNHFYQTLLFPGCVGGLEGDLCEVNTEDNQTYTISIMTGHIRSDEAPLSIDDIIVTYQNIVINNMWQHTYLERFADIEISQPEDDRDSLIFTFPTATSDNRDFFTLPLLPAHRVIELFEIDDYVELFAIDPVYSSCAFIRSSKDKNSLLIDLSRCAQTNINMYQIKLLRDIQALADHIDQPNNIISFYYGGIDHPDYQTLSIQDNLFPTMFFNTKSTKLSPRIQRALWGFLYHHIWAQDHPNQMTLYTWLLSHHQSTGTNLGDFIREKNPSLTYDKVLLEQWGVKTLPRIFTIDRAKRKYAFYLDQISEETYSFTIETPDPVYNLKAKTNQSVRYLDTTSEDNNKKHTITFTIGANQQIIEWLNMITIWGTVLWKLQEVASVDLYYLGTTSQVDTFDPITIIMFDNKIANYIRIRMRELFEEYGLTDLFKFTVYSSREEFQQALQNNNYDMALSTIQMRWLSDVYAILSSSKPEINLSQYLNPVLNQYMLDENRPVVRDIFGANMPFVVLWQLIKPYRIHNDLIVDISDRLPEKNLRQHLIRTISIVSNSQLDVERLRNRKIFMTYLQSLRHDWEEETQIIDELLLDSTTNE